MAVFRHQPWFRKQLEIGHIYANKIAEQLMAKGLVAIVSPMVMRPEEQDADDFRDEVDLLVSYPGGMPVHVESKSWRGTFTGPDDWPANRFICYRTNKKDPNMPVLCISRVTEKIVGVLDDGSMRYRKMITDPYPWRDQTPYEVWVAPKSLLLSFDQWVERFRNYRGAELIVTPSSSDLLSQTPEPPSAGSRPSSRT